MQVITGTPDFEHRAVGVKPDMKVLGPIFRKEAGKVVKALSGIDPADAAQQASGGGMIRAEVGSEVFEIPAMLASTDMPGLQSQYPEHKNRPEFLMCRAEPPEIIKTNPSVIVDNE